LGLVARKKRNQTSSQQRRKNPLTLSQGAHLSLKGKKCDFEPNQKELSKNRLEEERRGWRDKRKEDTSGF